MSFDFFFYFKGMNINVFMKESDTDKMFTKIQYIHEKKYLHNFTLFHEKYLLNIFLFRNMSTNE